jgi:hypothetical protein
VDVHGGKDGVFMDKAAQEIPECKDCSCCPKCSCCPCLPVCLPCHPCDGAARFVLSSKLSSEMQIMPLPLVKIRHVTARALTSTSAEAHIFSAGGVCTSCFPCISKLTWEATEPSGFKDANERTLELDALCPPWNKRTRINVAVKASVDLEELLSFMAKLQNGAPALTAGVPDADEGGNVSLLA